MNNDRKTCKLCCMEIPAGAKRCPFCRIALTRRGSLAWLWIFAPLLVFIPLVFKGGVVGKNFKEMFLLLAKCNVTGLESKQQSLEDVFMKYYGKDGESNE